MVITAALPVPPPAQAQPAERLNSADDLRRAMRHARIAPNPLGLDRVLYTDPARGHIEAQCGATWRSIVATLAGEFPSLAAFGSDPWLPPTLGESVALNAPGPDGRPIVAHVEALALVTPDGQLRSISRRRQPELFALAVGGCGAFGVPYSITLRLPTLVRSAAASRAPDVLELPAPAGTPAHRRVFYLPPPQLSDFLAQVRALAGEWGIPIGRVDVRATHAESETCLCWAQREYGAVALLLHAADDLGGRVRLMQLGHALTDTAIRMGGSFDLAAHADATRAQVLSCYPMLGAFLDEQRRYDPAERLHSAWLRRMQLLWRGERCAARWNAPQTLAAARAQLPAPFPAASPAVR